MDAPRVRQVSSGIASLGDRLGTAGETGSGLMAQLVEAWQGPDLEYFAREWTGAERVVQDSATSLRSYARELLAQVEQQEGASGDTGLPGRGGPARPPVGEEGGGNPDKADGHSDAYPYETIPGEVVEDGISPDDVSQGYLANCWFIATLQSLALQQPELLEDAIGPRNPDGTYPVTIYVDGEPVVVNVTPEFPAEDGDPAYADNPGRDGSDAPRELWPLLIEKAVAQHHGSYEDLEWDWPSTAMEVLTPHDVQTYDDSGWFDDIDLPSADSLRSTLEQGGSIVVTSSGDSDFSDAYQGEDALTKKHCYYVERIDADGTVHLRNPWGYDHPAPMSYEEFSQNFPRYDVATP